MAFSEQQYEELCKTIKSGSVTEADKLRKSYMLTGLEVINFFYKRREVHEQFHIFAEAVENKDAAVASLFIQADIHGLIPKKKAPLLIEAVKNENLFLAKRLLDFGFDPDWRDNNDMSARWVARIKGYDDLLQKMEEKFPSAKPITENGWHKIDDLTVAHVAQEQAVGYKLTDIFNFRSRERISLTQNLTTNAETRETRSFDDINDKAQLEEAALELNKRGGSADASTVYARTIRKGPLQAKDYPRVS